MREKDGTSTPERTLQNKIRKRICYGDTIIILLYIVRLMIPVYEFDYLGKLGFPVWLNFRLPNDNLKYLGEPRKAWKNKDGVRYWDFEKFIYTDGYGSFAYIIVKSESVKFGRHKIGIGSKREDVEKAYKGIRRFDEKDEEFNKQHLGVIDGLVQKVWVEFTFDSENRVSEISIFDGI